MSGECSKRDCVPLNGIHGVVSNIICELRDKVCNWTVPVPVIQPQYTGECCEEFCDASHTVDALAINFGQAGGRIGNFGRCEMELQCSVVNREYAQCSGQVGIRVIKICLESRSEIIPSSRYHTIVSQIFWDRVWWNI